MTTPWPQYPFIVPKAGSFLFRGGEVGCLLIHGYTASPEEMLPLGEFLFKKGYTVLGIRLAGHGTHPRDMIRTRYTDWLNSIQDGYFLLLGLAKKIILIGQSLGALSALICSPSIKPTATIGISTPFFPAKIRQKISNRILSMFFPLVPKWHLRRNKIENPRRETNYPAYPFFATRSGQEMEKIQQKMIENLGKIQTPVLLIQSRKDLPEGSINQITARLTQTKYESIWHDDMDHSMVQDNHRHLVFDEINQFIRQITRIEGNHE